MNNYDDLSPAIIRSGLKGMNSDLSNIVINYCVDYMTHDRYVFFYSFTLQMLRPSGAPRETSWLWPAWRDTGYLLTLPAGPS